MTLATALVVLLLAAIVVVLAAVLAVVTEGRYYGKSISRWTYEKFGPAIFRIQSEAVTWKRLAEDIHLGPSACVLDIGTAIGDLPISLAELRGQGLTAYGIELSPSMAHEAVQEAESRGVGDRTLFVIADASASLPFAGGVFSAVAAFGILEGMKSPARVLAEMDRIAASDGMLLVSVYRGSSSLIVALGEQWYRRELSKLGKYTTKRRPLRKTHDVLVATRHSS